MTSIDGQPVQAPFYNDNLPLRDELPRINTVPGAVAIQRVVDRILWVSQYINPLAFASRLARDPPGDVPARPFLLQVARGDQNIPTPMAMDLIRAGDFADRVSFTGTI